MRIGMPLARGIHAHGAAPAEDSTQCKQLCGIRIADHAEITQTAFDAISRERDEIAPSAGRVVEANGFSFGHRKSSLWMIILGPSKHRGANGLFKTKYPVRTNAMPGDGHLAGCDPAE